MKVKLVVFDMDGVLVNVESSWEYLHEKLGSLKFVKKSQIALDYYEGKISYYDWVIHDVKAMLKARNGKVHKSEIINILNEVKINDEALLIIPTLKRLGLKLAIVSGGIDILAKRVGKELGIDLVLANGLAFNEKGYLIAGGNVRVKPLEKNKVISKLANEHRLNLKEVMFVADSIFDVPALDVVGYPIVYRNRKVKSRCGKRYYYIDSLSQILNIIKTTKI